MRIGTRLKLAVWAPLLMSLVISTALFFSYRAMEEGWKNGSLVRQIRSSVTELDNFAHSYILYHEERPKQQFLLEHDSMNRLIAGIRLQNPDQQRLVDNIRRNGESMKDTFQRLVSNYWRPGQSGSVGLVREAEERLAGQLLVKTRELDTDASLLRSLVDNDTRNTQTRTIALVFFVMVLTTLPLTLVLVRTMRNITASLTTLRKGTEAIGSGRLDHKINMPSTDEIGVLSLSFDQMTERLQTLTVSRDELQKEVEERKRGERALEEKRLALERKNEELAAMNRELETFSYSVSHDLRAPLRHIAGFVELLNRRAAQTFDAENKRLLDVISEAAKRMGRLIDDLLAFSRTGRVKLELQKVDVNAMVRETIQGLSSETNGRSVDWNLRSLPDIHADPGLLKLVWTNLIANALKFTRSRDKTSIEIAVEEGKNEYLFSVRDNGVGFDMKYKDKLFAVFQRLHASEDFEGTGIGLANVQRIVIRHGGRVWAEGAPGEGATFFFTIPKLDTDL